MPSHTESERAKNRRAARSPRGKRKVHKVLGEFSRGGLRSSSGQTVKSRAQALAIALSEGRRAAARRK